MNQRYPSALLENAVNELASLPGVGRKTALRLALYMLRRDVGYTENFAAALVALRRDGTARSAIIYVMMRFALFAPTPAVTIPWFAW